MEPFVLVIFAMVYAGMILGELPRLALDRTGVALLGAIALLAGGAMTLAQAGAAVDVPTLALLVVFVATPWPREVAALGAAGVLLLSRRLHSRDKLGLVDWPLLVLFLGLFVVNGALAETGVAAAAVAALRDRGVDLVQPGWLLVATVALSNLVSNVPAVMLLLPHAQGPMGGPLLALASTLAGNLVLVGSIANLIVVDAASRHGIPVTWRRHARTGIPITLLTLLSLLVWGRS